MTRAHWLDLRIPPPVVAVLVAAAMWAVADVGPRIDLPPMARLVLAGTLVVVGLAFDVSGLLAFRASRTTFNPLAPQRATALVTDGVYRITRNPMYLGQALLLLAWALHLSSWLPLAGVPLHVAYLTRFQIRPEERALQHLFGDEFQRYARRVRRWL